MSQSGANIQNFQQSSDNLTEKNMDQYVEAKYNFQRKKLILMGVAIAIILGLIIGGVVVFAINPSQKNENVKVQIPKTFTKYKSQILKGQENNILALISVPLQKKDYKIVKTEMMSLVSGSGEPKSLVTIYEFNVSTLCSQVTDEFFEYYVYVQKGQFYDGETPNKKTNIPGYPQVSYEQQQQKKNRELYPNENYIRRIRMLDEERNLYPSLRTFRQFSQDLLSEYRFYEDYERQEGLDEPFEDSDGRVDRMAEKLDKVRLRILKDEEQAEKDGTLSKNDLLKLMKNGFTEAEYILSTFPIFRIQVAKTGEIRRIHQPLNVNKNIFEAYLSILDQIFPVVAKDYSKITKQDKNGNTRVLSEQKIFTKYRVLDMDVQVQQQVDVKPNQSNGEGSVNKQFSSSGTVGEKSEQSVSYDQETKMQNGSVVDSNSSLSASFDNNASKDNAKSIEDSQDSKGFAFSRQNGQYFNTQFLSQTDQIDVAEYNQIINDFSKMYFFDYSSIEDARFQMFEDLENQPSEETKEKIQRIMKQTLEGSKSEEEDPVPKKKQGDKVQKPLFRKDVMGIEVGADITSECVDTQGKTSDYAEVKKEGENSKSGGGGQDKCQVGLCLYIGVCIPLFKKNVDMNTSELLRTFQSIIEKFKTFIRIIKDGILGGLKSISDDFLKLINLVHEFLEIKTNPVTKNLLKIVYNDQLGIISGIKEFENTVNKGIQFINKVTSDPLGFLKERLLSFVAGKHVSLYSQVNQVRTFFVSKFTTVLNIIKENRETGISQNTYLQIEDLLKSYQGLLLQLVDDPIKNYFAKLQENLQNKATDLLGKVQEVDDQSFKQKQIQIKEEDQDNPKLKAQADNQKFFNKIKKMLATTGIIDGLQNLVKNVVKQIVSQADMSKELINDARKEIDPLVKQIQEIQLNIIQGNENYKRKAELESTLTSFQGVFQFGVDLESGLREFQDEMKIVFENLKDLLSGKASGLIVELFEVIMETPTKLASKLANQGLKTISEMKKTGTRIKDSVKTWTNSIQQTASGMKDKAEDMFNELVDFFDGETKVPIFDDSYFSTPLFDEIWGIIKDLIYIFKFDYKQLLKPFKEVVKVPGWLVNFIKQIMVFFKDCFNYVGQIKFAITSINIDIGALWGKVSKPLADTKATIKNENVSKTTLRRLRALGILDQPNSDVDGTPFKDIFGEVTNNLSKFMGVSSGDLAEGLDMFKELCKSNSDNSGHLFLKMLFAFIKGLKIQLRFSVFKKEIAHEVKFFFAPFPLSVGIEFAFIIEIFVNIGFDKGALVLGLCPNLRFEIAVTLNIDLLAIVLGAEIRGEIINTTFNLFLTLQFLNNFDGCIELNLNIQAFVFSFGVFIKINLFITTIKFYVVGPLKTKGISKDIRIFKVCWGKYKAEQKKTDQIKGKKEKDERIALKKKKEEEAAFKKVL